MKKYTYLIIGLFFCGFLFAETEQPIYDVTDPAVNENFRSIYLVLDQHKHNQDGSSRLNDIIPSTGSAYDIGTSTDHFNDAYAKRFFMKASTQTPSILQDNAVIYSSGTTAEVFVMDESGNVTQISPHNKEGRWVFNSFNVNTGKRLYVDMEKLIRTVEKLSGEKLIK